MFKDKRKREISGILLIFFSIILFLAVFTFNIHDMQLLHKNKEINNIAGPAGAIISYYLRLSFGISSYLIVLMFGLTGWRILKNNKRAVIIESLFSIFFLTITSSALITLINDSSLYYNGGILGFYIYKFLKTVIGSVGSFLTILILNLIGLIILGIISLTGLIEIAGSKKDIPKKILSILKKYSFSGLKRDVPYNFIEEELRNKNEKMPWVTRKKVKIYNDLTETEDFNDIKYIEMLAPQEKHDHSGAMLYEPEDAGLFAYKEDRCNEIILDKKSGTAINNSNEFFTEDSEVFYEDNISIKKISKPEESEEIGEDKIDFINTERDADPILTNRIKNIDMDKTTPNDAVLDEHLQAEADKKNSSDSVSGEYTVPSEIFQSSERSDSKNWQEEIKRISTLLVNTLADFGIESKVVNVNRGPVITLYEIQIAPGIKVNKIVGLSDDIAMALAALRVRIVAPIPGKSAIGVEIPNRIRESVTLGDIINSKEYRSQNGLLKVVLGKDILGKPVTFDLKRQPHLLIAGATGSGKSVCVNSIIASLIYNYNPSYLRFILIDPKMVELQIYNGLPHLLTPVITESQSAQIALKWIIFEMDRRYKLLSQFNCRDIERYNNLIGTENDERRKLPYIVTIIDELADLMMVSSKEVEGSITRIAQKARAVGIHLVLATQRPSVDVITGIIKANFPARIAFQVAQKTDSRTIIDQNGAEKLLGKGDMLYQSPISSFPVRIQGAFISEDEILGIVDHLSQNYTSSYVDFEECISEFDNSKDREEEADELFSEALKIIEETRKASASYLQRRLSIGYNRAARIIELMEDKGYVGPQQGSKPREVYI